MTQNPTLHRQIELVLFDLGNTLLYFDSPWSEVLESSFISLVASLKKSGLQLDSQNFCAEFSIRLKEYYIERDTELREYSTEYVLRTLLSDSGYAYQPIQVIRPALDAMYAVTQQHWLLEEDAIPTLQELSHQGYRIGLVSNAGDSNDVNWLVDRSGLRPYLEHVIISADVGYRKPHPRIFEHTLEAFGVPAERAVMVGDTPGADILGARDSSLGSIWITRRAKTPSHPELGKVIVPDATVGTLHEIPDVLEHWKTKTGE